MATVDAQADTFNDPQVLYQLKQQAIEYYKHNGVPQKMETILNSMFYDKPSDVFGHLVSVKIYISISLT